MIIIFNKETKEIHQVIWADKLPEGVELSSDEQWLTVKPDIDEHKLHKCLIRLDGEGRLAEILAPIKVNLIANKNESRMNVPILQDAHYFEVNADGVDELVFHVELDEEPLPAWVKDKLAGQRIRIYQSVDGQCEESYVGASELKGYEIRLQLAEPKEWIFCFDNWMIEAVNILVRAKQQ